MTIYILLTLLAISTTMVVWQAARANEYKRTIAGSSANVSLDEWLDHEATYSHNAECVNGYATCPYKWTIVRR